MKDIPYALLITGVVLTGLWIANILFDLKVPHYISRKVGHSAGGVSFLLSPLLFSSPWWPIGLAAAFSILLWLARRLRPGTFRGVGGSGRSPSVMAEVWFALISVPVFAVGWAWLDRPYEAMACLLFMAWGDCLTGLVRSQVYGRPVKGLWGSVAMLVVCLIIAWAFIDPFWIGLLGAIAATLTEYAFGDTGHIKWADDNWAVPVISLAVVMGILAATGNL